METTSKNVINVILRTLALSFGLFFMFTMLMGGFDPFSGTMAMAFLYSDLDWEGGDNIGGFTSTGYLAIHHEVGTWPTFNRNATTDAEMVELTGDYVMKEGKKFYKVYFSQRTAGAESENQGEIDGKSFMQKPTFFIPGTRTQNLAAARKLNNARGILLVKDPNTGDIIQFGDEDFPLHFKPRVAFGNQPTDRRGLFVDCEADNFNAALIYKGTIPLTPADAPSS